MVMVRRVAHRGWRYAVAAAVTWRGHVAVAARPGSGLAGGLRMDGLRQRGVG